MFNKGYRILSILRDIIFKISWKQTFLLIENSRSSPKIIFSKSRSFKKYSISNDTLTKKFHEAHFKTIVNLLVKKDYNCLDLGAHIGMHSIFLSKRVKAKVYSFEPASLLFSIFQLNILKNNIKNIIPFNLAASNKTGKGVNLSQLNFENKLLNTGVIGIELKSSYNSGNNSATIKIDELNLPKISFIKIDIQGSEFAALTGMNNLIKKDSPFFFIEIEEFYLAKMNTSSKQIFNFFKKKNYTLFLIKKKIQTDFICVPNKKLNNFEKKILSKLDLTLIKI
jgi:FkbM family methyltransferase